MVRVARARAASTALLWGLLACGEVSAIADHDDSDTDSAGDQPAAPGVPDLEWVREVDAGTTVFASESAIFLRLGSGARRLDREGAEQGFVELGNEHGHLDAHGPHLFVPRNGAVELRDLDGELVSSVAIEDGPADCSVSSTLAAWDDASAWCTGPGPSCRTVSIVDGAWSWGEELPAIDPPEGQSVSTRCVFSPPDPSGARLAFMSTELHQPGSEGEFPTLLDRSGSVWALDPRPQPDGEPAYRRIAEVSAGIPHALFAGADGGFYVHQPPLLHHHAPSGALRWSIDLDATSTLLVDAAGRPWDVRFEGGYFRFRLRSPESGEPLWQGFVPFGRATGHGEILQALSEDDDGLLVLVRTDDPEDDVVDYGLIRVGPPPPSDDAPPSAWGTGAPCPLGTSTSIYPTGFVPLAVYRTPDGLVVATDGEAEVVLTSVATDALEGEVWDAGGLFLGLFDFHPVAHLLSFPAGTTTGVGHCSRDSSGITLSEGGDFMALRFPSGYEVWDLPSGTFRGKVTRGPLDELPSQVQIAPGGGRIVAQPGHQVYWANVPGEIEWVDEWDPFWSWQPGGNALFLEDFQGILHVLGEQGEWEVLSTQPAEEALTGNDLWAHRAAWAPDGHAIAWIEGASLLLADPDGGHVRIASTLNNPIIALKWAPDSTRVLVKESIPGGPNEGYPRFIEAVEGGEVSPQFTAAINPYFYRFLPLRISPDGQHIATACTGKRAFCVDNRTFLEPEYVEDWRWSPDSSRVAYRSYDSTQSGVYVLELDGDIEEATPHFAPGSAVELLWSPDGKYVAWTDAYAARWVGTADLSEVVELHGQYGATGEEAAAQHFSWSADSTWLYYEKQDADESDLYRVRRDGSETLRLNLQPVAEVLYVRP